MKIEKVKRATLVVLEVLRTVMLLGLLFLVGREIDQYRSDMANADVALHQLVLALDAVVWLLALGLIAWAFNALVQRGKR